MALSREEEVDLTLLKNDSGVESALLYAKAWSKYIKDLLAWVEKRLAMGEASRPSGHWVIMFIKEIGEFGLRVIETKSWNV